MLNHHELDSTSFSYAVYGGNIEITKIVEQNLKTNNEISNLKNRSEKVGIIIPSIMKHQNKIFDWILEQKFTDKDKNDLPRLIDSSLLNRNAHSLIELIDKGFTFSDNSMIWDAILKAANRGFYKIIQLIINIANQKPLFDHNNNKFNRTTQYNYLSLVAFENTSILKIIFDTNSLNGGIVNDYIDFAITNNSKYILYFPKYWQSKWKDIKFSFFK